MRASAASMSSPGSEPMPVARMDCSLCAAADTFSVTNRSSNGRAVATGAAGSSAEDHQCATPIPPEAYVRRLAALCSVLTCLVAVAAAGPATAGSAGTFSSAASPRTGIGHVWVVVLENEGIDKTFLHNANPYLGKTLQKRSEERRVGKE